MNRSGDRLSTNFKIFRENPAKRQLQETTRFFDKLNAVGEPTRRNNL